MTTRLLFRAIFRRWYVMLLAVVVAAGAYVLLERDGGTYSTKPVVAFLLPGGESLAAGNGLENEAVISFAATVAESINNGRPAERYSRDSAPLYGAGIRQDVRISVPSDGTQWRANFPRAEIAISIVGSDRAWVEATQRQYLEKIVAISEAQQIAIGAVETERIHTEVMPLTTAIEYVSAGRTAELAAMGALLAAALILGAWVSVLLERRSASARRRVPTGHQQPMRSAAGPIPSRYPLRTEE
ncbi:hypothetical protein [Agromyces sp. Leaf222]|uniref:hypothetical protein n=1 Tax=Agromyces sp. Leaf222 TaxID=1735688 RepID=UPI0006FA30D2|nr:hypothetical protein [Agromyces sp. Leaf222]KQM81440.1 hypothetical protein ASE68_16905 [Agromyces sp. Leaf222]